MDCSLHIFTTWAKSQQNGDAIFNGPDRIRSVPASFSGSGG